jgi:putative phosphoesterase
VRIGLVADTHDEIAPYDAVADKLAGAFDGVELILHCGDLTTTGVLDRLGELAPVVAVRSANDPSPEPPRLVEGPHILEVGGLVIGLVNTLGDADPGELFGRPVDVVVHGGTHAASIERTGGVLRVNPGSPTLAEEVTVAVLDIADGRAEPTVVALG